VRINLYIKLKTISILIILLSQIIFAQSDSLKNTDSHINNILEDLLLEDENSELYDLVEQYIENPINLNTSDLNEIMKLPLIDIEVANSIVKYRSENGRIFSYSELKSIANISSNSIKILKAFTFLERRESKIDSSFLENLNIKLRSRFSQNIQEAEGYKNGFYIGTPAKIYNRLLIDVNHKIQLGLLIDKDAGEKSIADFHSYYFQAKNVINGLKFTGGFYTMEFGQGLALWSPYSFSKGSNATNSIIKRARGISPYTSAGEYLYLKGAAFQYSSNFFELSSFYSFGENNYNLSQNTYGFVFTLQPINFLKLSALYMIENKNTFDNGSEINSELNKKHISFNYELTYGDLFLTGEFAIYNSSLANINTLQLSLLRSIVVVASIRNYPNTYESTYGQGFGETKNTNNEFGIYFGLQWRTDFGIINFYLDQFKFPNSNASIALPSSGNEISFNYEIVLFPKTEFTFRYFSENKEVLELLKNENIVENRKTEKLRFELNYKANNFIQLKSRVELLYLNKIHANEKGILLFEDVKLNFFKNLSINGRIVFFQTNSFASRIYEFENDLSGVMANPALYNSGIKWYFLIKYNPINTLYLTAKYSELYKPNEKNIGSGNNLIEGNIDNKFSLQIDFTF